MRNPYLYKNQKFSESKFQNISFKTIMESCKDDVNIYYKYYVGDSLVHTVSFLTFYKKVMAFARFLDENYGISEEENILVQTENNDLIFVIYAALFSLGVTAVPIEKCWSKKKLDYIIADTKATKIILLDEIRGCSLTPILFEERLFKALDDLPKLERVETDTMKRALIFYVDGAVNSYKGIALSIQNLIAKSESIRIAHEFNKTAKILSVLPFTHLNNFIFSFMSTLYAKSRLIFCSDFFLQSFWKLIEKEKISVANLTPTLLDQLNSDLREFDTKEVKQHLKYFISSIAPLSHNTLNLFYERFSIKVLQSYGLSEAVNFALCVPGNINNETYFELFVHAKDISSGTALDGNEVVILDETCKELDEREVGEVAIRGWNVMLGYYNRLEETRNKLRCGFLHSGDTGYFRYIEGEKYFYILGKESETILKNNKRYYPFYIENKIKHITGLEKCAVVGFKNTHTNEEIGLFVIKNNNTPSKDQILKLSQRLLGDRAPIVVVFGKTIPASSIRGIQRDKLKKHFEEFEETDFSSLES